MGDSGALALGFLLALIAVEGVLKTAATIALAGPLLVMAVPILDTSFVVLKRPEVPAPAVVPRPQPLLPPLHADRLLAATHRGVPAPVGDHAVGLRDPGAVQVAAAAGRVGRGNVVLVSALGVLVVVASVWMAYTLEILKARHLQALGLGRLVRAELAEEVAREGPESGGRPPGHRRADGHGWVPVGLTVGLSHRTWEKSGRCGEVTPAGRASAGRRGLAAHAPRMRPAAFARSSAPWGRGAP